MTQSDPQLMKACCSEIIAGAGTAFSWKWDDRFEAVLTSFAATQASVIRSLLGKHFPPSWTSQTLPTASPAVRKISEILGGLGAGQELFVAEISPSVILAAAWWPWSGGSPISLRLLLQIQNDVDPNLIQEFRGWFGV